MSDFIMDDPQSSPEMPDVDLGPYIDLPLQAPRRVRIGRGWNWIYDGFGLFNRGMGVSVGICLFSMVISIASNLIPGANLLYVLFSLVFGAGYMMVAHNAFRYGSIRFNDFFEGFRHQMGQLVLAEVIYFAFTLGVILLVVIGGVLMIGVSAFTSGGLEGLDDLTVALAILLGCAVMMLLLIPLVMLVLFAAPLVFFHRVPAWEALKLSLRACWLNIWSLSWWGLIALLLLLLGTLMLLVGLLVILPVLQYSLYMAYRDIFLHDGA